MRGLIYMMLLHKSHHIPTLLRKTQHSQITMIQPYRRDYENHPYKQLKEKQQISKKETKSQKALTCQ